MLRTSSRSLAGLSAAALLGGLVATTTMTAPAVAASGPTGSPFSVVVTLDDYGAADSVPVKLPVVANTDLVLQPWVRLDIDALPASCPTVTFDYRVDGSMWGSGGSAWLSSPTDMKVGDSFLYNPPPHLTNAYVRSLSVSVQKQTRCPAGGGGGTIKFTFWTTSCSAPRVEVKGPTVGLKVGDRIMLEGCGGADVTTITYGSFRQVVRGKKWSFRMPPLTFTDALKGRCTGAITVTSGSVRKRIPIAGTPKTYVYVAEGVKRKTGGAIRAGEMLCVGDAPVVMAKAHAWAVTTAPGKAASLSIDTVTRKGVKVVADTVMWGPSGAITFGTPSGRVSITPRAGVNARVSPARFDLQDDNGALQPGVTVLQDTVLVPQPPEAAVVLDSLLVARKSVLVNGNLLLRNAWFYGSGDLTVLGSATANAYGSLITRGRLKVTGAVSLRSVAGTSSVVLGGAGITFAAD